jgi:carboxypeptidase family protein/TonB-dependent receptor-like protein
VVEVLVIIRPPAATEDKLGFTLSPADIRRAMGIALSVLVIPAVLAGQQVSGNLIGQVTDEDARPVVDVRVSVEGTELPGLRFSPTDSGGGFRFSGLPVGTYDVHFQRLGYRSLTLTDVTVRLGKTISLRPVRLEVEAVELAPLVVRGSTSLIDPTSSAISMDLLSSVFESLPTERDYKSIIQLLPQANRSFLGDPVNVAGSTGLENMYYVEGVNVTDLYRGSTGTDLPFNFVKAIEVQQAGYAAEYGQALGGLINVVTRSGTPEFEWSAVGFYSGSGVSANARPIPNVLSRDSFTDFDLGLSASGPIVDSALTFFAAYNPRFVSEDISLKGLGLENATITKQMFAVKLDWRVSERTDVAFSVFGDPTTERRVSPAPGVKLANPDPILTSRREGGTNVALRWTHRISNRLHLEGSLGRHARSEDAEGATELGRSEPSFIDRTNLPTITLSGGNGTNQQIGSTRTSARASASLWAAGHALKFGLEFQRNSVDVQNDESPGQIARLSDSVYRSSIFIQDFTTRNRVLSLYLQDGWSVSDRLRLNLGLRWDGQYLIDQNGDVGQSITDQFQPRIGFAFLPDGEGRSKIFGHAGRFYQQLALFWSTIGLAGFDQRQDFSSVDLRQFPGQVDSTLVISDPTVIRGGTDDLRGEHHDEFVLGYEQQIGSRVVVGVSGIHRNLKESITAAFRPDRVFAGGNPGRGELSHLPRSRRKYWALDFSVRVDGARLQSSVSYVLSRTRGNYPGLFVAEAGGLRGGSLGPNNSQLTYFPAQPVNGYGPLPNDRTHVFKVSSSFAATDALNVGVFFVARSGIPLSELGRVTGGFNAPIFLSPRGSEGRTPSTWDLNFRFAYRMPAAGGRVVVDLLHLGNPQSVVNVDQRRFSGAKGSPFAPFDVLVANQVGARAGFATPIGFQPPFQLRVGFEVTH